MVLFEEFLRRKRPNKLRSKHWWEKVVCSPNFLDEDWKENFRVSHDTFVFLTNELREELTPKTNYRSKRLQIAVEKKIAVALYFLASCCEYRVVANQFGIHKSTVCKIIIQFVNAVNKVLQPKFIQFPNEAEAIGISSFFNFTSKIPNIIGVIDGSHIPVLPPKNGYKDFINRKGWASLVLQGVVDHRFKFLDISIKNPGSCHDAAVLISSSLYKNIHNIMPKGTVDVDGKMLNYVIVGDPAYPLLPWLVKNYQNTNITAEEESFNLHMNSARVCVEIAFGRLKARWRCLSKRLDVHHTIAPHVIAACCCLHNIVETFNDGFLTKWMSAVEEADVMFPQPSTTDTRQHDLEGYNIRIFLTEYLSQKYPLRRRNLL